MHISFTGSPARAVDSDGGETQIVCLASPEQRSSLLTLRSDDSLYLDGFTTWLRHTARREAVTDVGIEVWFAPRAFARGDESGFTALLDATDAAPAFALGHLSDGRLAARIGERTYPAADRLMVDAWNRVRLQIGRQGVRMGLGDDLRIIDVPLVGGVGTPTEVFLGRSSRCVGGVGSLSAACAVGLLHRAIIGDVRSPTPAPVAHGSPADTSPDRARYDTDAHRPIAHVTAPQGWMNEPHAAFERRGIHHIFFQHNAAGPYWDHISWGHATSHDLVHWDDEPIAVHPGSSPLASDGVWSGSSVPDDEGEHLLFVTAGSFDRVPDQSVAVARPAGSRWRVDEAPAIEMPGTIDGAPLVLGQFRDPFAWREGGDWFMLVGAGIQGKGGAALLYRSPDGVRWQLARPLLVGSVSRHPATGVMWELPVLLPVGEGSDGAARHALFIAPWWPGANEHHLRHVWHWVGRWDARTGVFVPDHEEPREFDGGGHLTGPSGTVLADGRSILWTISQDKRSLEDQLTTGWAHNAGVPLELGLTASGHLRVRPIAELELLHEEPLPVRDGRIRGRHLDVSFAVEGSVEIDVFGSEDGRERTTLIVGVEAVAIDRTRTSLTPAYCESPRWHPRPRPRQITDVRLLLDGSMIELWVGDDTMITSRAYTVLGGELVQIRPVGGAVLHAISAHSIHSAYRPRKATEC